METTKAVEQLEPPYSQATASAAGLGTSMALPWPESWTAVSCAISGNGEILVIEHTVQGVTAERARCLATIAAGKRVGIQRLTQEEARDRYGARADQLIGCTITGLVLRQRQPTACKGMDRDAGKRDIRKQHTRTQTSHAHSINTHHTQHTQHTWNMPYTLQCTRHSRSGNKYLRK